jgi:hypothetical protein
MAYKNCTAKSLGRQHEIPLRRNVKTNEIAKLSYTILIFIYLL